MGYQIRSSKCDKSIRIGALTSRWNQKDRGEQIRGTTATTTDTTSETAGEEIRSGRVRSEGETIGGRTTETCIGRAEITSGITTTAVTLLTGCTTPIGEEAITLEEIATSTPKRNSSFERFQSDWINRKLSRQLVFLGLFPKLKFAIAKWMRMTDLRDMVF